MKPQQKPHSNMVLKAPAEWNEDKQGKCHDLYATRADGVFYTYWKPTIKEKIKLIFGVPLRLSVCADYFPPVCLEVVDDK